MYILVIELCSTCVETLLNLQLSGGRSETQGRGNHIITHFYLSRLFLFLAQYKIKSIY